MSDATVITTVVSMGVAYLGSLGLIAHVLGARIDDLRDEMRAGFADVRGEMHGGFADVRGEMHGGFAGVHARIDDQSARITRVEDRLDTLAQIVAEHEGRLK